MAKCGIHSAGGTNPLETNVDVSLRSLLNGGPRKNFFSSKRLPISSSTAAFGTFDQAPGLFLTRFNWLFYSNVQESGRGGLNVPLCQPFRCNAFLHFPPLDAPLYAFLPCVARHNDTSMSRVFSFLGSSLGALPVPKSCSIFLPQGLFFISDALGLFLHFVHSSEIFLNSKACESVPPFRSFSFFHVFPRLTPNPRPWIDDPRALLELLSDCRLPPPTFSLSPPEALSIFFLRGLG